ncbi:hypothetical protein [Gordonia sp. KTR9]|uniref:hypothetical protein n=1 Tax=Gordonia sp. KTR9 TaxID=337191 RepID=UPI00027DE23B|nr:hypothetical protein [Gordonia sp. KTR9]AFR49103.1 hypothetical protein KTR9_2466 [Gordonia sp. KTR9]
MSRTRGASIPHTLWLAAGLMCTGASLQLIGMFYALSLVESINEEVRARHYVRLGPQPAQSNYDAIDNAVETGTTIGAGLVVSFCLAAAGLWLFMAYANARGFTWARLMATVIGVVGLVFGLTSLAADDRPVTEALNVLLVAVELAVLILLWLPGSNAYYRRVSATK